jgi:hypothetical protein
MEEKRMYVRERKREWRGVAEGEGAVGSSNVNKGAWRRTKDEDGWMSLLRCQQQVGLTGRVESKEPVLFAGSAAQRRAEQSRISMYYLVDLGRGFRDGSIIK